MKYSVFVSLALALAAAASPTRRNSFDLANGQAAIALNQQFQTLAATASCTTGQQACINGGFALCAFGKYALEGCAPGTTCAALPNTGAPGTVIACTTQADINARIAATGATSAGSGAGAASSAGTATTAAAASSSSGVNNAGSSNTTTSSAAIPSISDTATANNPDLQNSLTLDNSVIATGFLNNGQAVQEAGQVASLTSGNNFINFCATRPDLQITNGLQITTGSCNPAPMGLIPSKANMPSAKFQFPVNGGSVPANKSFNISLAIQGMQTGFFVNAQQNYFAAPQQLNAQGQVIGHSHVVVEALTSPTQTTPTNPTQFAFFKGLNAPAANGVLTVAVPTGLPAGAYKVSTINTAANHQPILVPIAQHGSLDDAVYFTAQ